MQTTSQYPDFEGQLLSTTQMTISTCTCILIAPFSGHVTSFQETPLQLCQNKPHLLPFVSRKSAKAFCLPNLAPAGMFGPNGGTSFERLTATLTRAPQTINY